MYIVSVVTKEANWRNFKIFAYDNTVLPAFYVDQIDGSEFLEERVQEYSSPKVPLGINIGKNKTTANSESHKDYTFLYEKFKNYGDYIVINVSSPNTPGLRENQTKDALEEIMRKTKAKIGDSIFLACERKNQVEKITSLARDKIAQDLKLIDENTFAFCWIVDYPMYEKDEMSNKIKFSHNPFSMPQGDLDQINFEKPLDILAYQYDIVCNGIELSSGAIRNHIPELMYKLFSIAGYKKEEVNDKFSGMISALSYGAPPHGGIAPGIDRIVMLLANEKNIREVTMFPMNQNAQDLMMNAPSEISDDQLKELNLNIKKKK